MKGVRDWIVDQQDRVRAGVKILSGRYFSILVYDLEKNKWSQILEKKIDYDAEDVNLPVPMGFAKDPDILYIRADYNGRDAIFRADISKSEPELELMVKDDKYDIDGSLIYSPKTKDAVGVNHSEAEGGSVYWDEKYRTLQAAIDQALPDTTNYLADFSRDENIYLVYSVSDRIPGVYYLGDFKNKTMNIIGHAYPQLEGRLQGNKKITYISRDGETVEAYLTMPPGCKPGIPSPAVIIPNCQSIMRDHGNFDYLAEYFASKGILVFQPNFKDSPGDGEKFVKEAANDFGASLKDDLADAHKWLVEQKLADPGRIAVAGTGYGGYAALSGASDPSGLYRCAVSFAGISDLSLLLKSSNPDTGYTRLLKNIQTDKQTLESLSPVNHVDKINIPILLGHSDDDMKVPVEQSQKLAKELKKKKKVFTYIELENGDHDLSIQRHRHRFFNAMDEFLDKYMLN